MKRNGFELRVVPRSGGEYGVALCEVRGGRRGSKDEEPQQVVRVWTARGWVVLASDASHLYFNMMQGSVFPSVARVDEMLEGFRTLHKLSGGSWDHVIPGHDPLVMHLYRAPSRELEGIVVRLDAPPLPMP